MSLIRYATKIPGQKNTSRTYAWEDISGGIVIDGRGGQIRISYPEFHYLAHNFFRHLENNRRKGEDDIATLHRLHRGFFKHYDEAFEKQHAKRMKKLMATIRANQARQKKRKLTTDRRHTKKWLEAAIKEQRKKK